MRAQISATRAISGRRCPHGFTLVELVLVLLLLSILAAVAAPRFFNLQPFREASLIEETAAAVRYGQKLALATRCEVRVRVNADGLAYALDWGEQSHCAEAGSVSRPVRAGNPFCYRYRIGSS
ncbi:hypothetical protein CAI21_13310 [Alkalilimnicola ehrlichii]|uniref:General secretion pathway protein H n=1 Tax=Alkalilimnicola ehrlichii TaxID=351052 RepID=A0A3E0WR59_9GAMM|nr:prepilin-type N-terminal cleavage/methylation domain-containing protein [Alkalilimnicola ehrlichii]RFA28288.1 hypothetical protein CAI21_13310 [Alkalilimnicola ehrlichii]RFA34889.1 hypothetical protein CAL65_14445 [Alkalilimnicola ehrlichii]